MTRGSTNRRQAQALQDVLERYELALAKGSDPAAVRAEVSESLGDLGSTFVLATSMVEKSAAIEPDPAFVRRVAAQLRTAPAQTAPASRVAVLRRAVPRFSFAPLALAASVLAAALILIPSFRSLPGDPLYALKGASEDARVWFATGSGEARVRLDLASTRFEEVERLVDRARVIVAGPGVTATGATDIDDPELARLIESTLQAASQQLEVAANILTETPSPRADLRELLKVTQRGRTLTAHVAEELPNRVQPPVLQTGVKFAQIEAKAKAAQDEGIPEPTPGPCDTPTPSPTASPSVSPSSSPSASPSTVPSSSPTASAVATETPATPTASPTPQATPCVSPKPTPTQTPKPTPSPTVDPSVAPSPTGSPSTAVSSTSDATPQPDTTTSGATAPPRHDVIPNFWRA